MPLLLQTAQLLRSRPWTRGLRFKHNDIRFAKQYQHKTYIEPLQPVATYPPPPPPTSFSWQLFKWAGALTLAYFVGFHVNEARSEQKLKDIGVITADIKQREVMMAEAGLAMMKEGMSQSNPDALMSLYREEAVEPENTETATGLLHSASSSFNINGGSVHCTRLGANIPNHTTVTYAGLDERMPWRAACLGIYDGYGGGGTAYYLADNLVTKILADMFAAQNVIKRDADVSSIIKSAFAEVDRDLLDSARQLLDSTYRTADIVNFSSPALSGSCALIALFDPQKKILHVANAGDSRAVLGRWDPQAEKYVAIPLSTDHNGYSQHEVARLRKEHPKEKVVDPETGEFLGLPVTRAFGLAAFKWPADVTRAACERIWAPRPKHADSRRTPPYLTAEPEVAQTDVRGGGDHPDFLITANQTLWKFFNDQDAVTCVEAWLNKYRPSEAVDQDHSYIVPRAFTSKLNYLMAHGYESWQRTGEFSLGSEPIDDPNRDRSITDKDDTFIDKKTGRLGWKAQTKHFVVEDDHCGVHLVKNALGGSRRGLFESVMSLRPPLAKEIRGDFTLIVTFFDDKATLPGVGGNQMHPEAYTWQATLGDQPR